MGARQVAVREGGIFIDGFRVQTASAPVLPWRVFLCPACSRVRYKLFEVGGRWACYRCHGLTHASRHKHRTIPNYDRLMRLRRKIGASLVPFSPIAPRPSRQRKYWRVVREIRQLEAGLIGHIREDVADVLVMADNADHDSIILAAAIGHPIHDIARSHDLTVVEVRKIIDEIADWMLPDKHQRVAGVH